MSNPRIFAMKRANKGETHYKVVLGSRHFTRSGEKGEALYDAALRYKNAPTDENLAAIEDMLNPYMKYVRDGDLIEENGKLYLPNAPEVALPESLANTIMEYLDKGYPIESLQNFWSWALLNPSAKARDGMFKYCQQYGVTLTNSGMMMLYKAVTHKTLDKSELPVFVGREYLDRKIDQVQRDGDPVESFRVFRRGDGTLVSINGSDEEIGENWEYQGFLVDLFKNIDELSMDAETLFTDKFSRTMDIKLGIPVQKDREECDPNINNECSHGLHVGSYEYVSWFGSSSDTIFAALVNPMNVVALPEYDNSKIRVCEYMPYAIMNNDEGDWEELESAFFEEEYTPYVAKTLQQLAKELEVSDFTGDMDDEDFQLAVRKQTIVKAQLHDLRESYDGDLDEAIANVPDAVEAPSEDSFYDQTDPYARNTAHTRINWKDEDSRRGWEKIFSEQAHRHSRSDLGYDAWVRNCTEEVIGRVVDGTHLNARQIFAQGPNFHTYVAEQGQYVTSVDFIPTTANFLADYLQETFSVSETSYREKEEWEMPTSPERGVTLDENIISREDAKRRWMASESTASFGEWASVHEADGDFTIDIPTLDYDEAMGLFKMSGAESVFGYFEEWVNRQVDEVRFRISFYF